MRILIVAASQTGRTWRLAEAIAEGARAAGAEVELVRAEEATPAQALAADALIFGSGVHMAGVASTMRAFFERLAPLWLTGGLVGKLGAVFASAGNGGRGGGELALISLAANVAEHGMLLVPMHNRLAGYLEGGCHWGPLAWTNSRNGASGPTAAHLAAARAHGEHVARVAARWLGGAGTAP